MSYHLKISSFILFVENQKLPHCLNSSNVINLITFDPVMRAIPTDNFRFCPPDSVLENLCLFASRPRTPTISLTSFWTVFDGHPFNYNIQSIMK